MVMYKFRVVFYQYHDHYRSQKKNSLKTSSEEPARGMCSRKNTEVGTVHDINLVTSGHVVTQVVCPF
jgi:hypothetical protein